MTNAGLPMKRTISNSDLPNKKINYLKPSVATGSIFEFGTDKSQIKTSLAALEGEAGGQVRGETLQLQKSLKELTTESKFKDAEIQKYKDVIIYFDTTNK